jgi:hypothetical protein
MSQFSIWLLSAVVLVCLGAAAGYLFFRPRKPSKAKQKPLPTEWALNPRAVFSTDERRLYRLLSQALPNHIILAKLPLVRFCQPIDPQEVHYWYDLLGNIQVALAVCSPSGRVLAAIDLDTTDRGNPKRLLQIKRAVLGACRIQYLRVPFDQFPTAAELQRLVPSSPANVTPATPSANSMQSTYASGEPLYSAAVRRAERPARWRDTTGGFQDSFFAPDIRVDEFAGGDDGNSISSAPDSTLSGAPNSTFAGASALVQSALASVSTRDPGTPPPPPRRSNG